MKMESVSTAKGRRRASAQLISTDGTRVRRLYDLLMANKGIPLDVPLTKFDGRPIGRVISCLTDYYGLDIRKLHNGRWVLAGEWFGPAYRDYIADRIHAAERRP